MSKLLIIDSNISAYKIYRELFNEFVLYFAANANDAMNTVDENDIELIITELSLANHSGMEFIYEFRTYDDWRNVPIIVYSNIKLEDQVLKSRTWSKLNIYNYLYKPNSSLKKLQLTAEKALVLKNT